MNTRPDSFKDDTPQDDNPIDMITEDDISRLTRLFYGWVRKDELLGPIFNKKIGETDETWIPHIEHINDFWSSIFLKSKRFSGNPMIKHAALPGLNPAHFSHWLDLFAKAGKATLSPHKQEQFNMMARRIAQSLQMGLAMNYPLGSNNEDGENPFIGFALKRPSVMHASRPED